ncbi:MAG TPA: class I SAM-dependent methyltransferase [Mycobacteriales bacterium]|jgi:2-polyprenyl-3-methyl-5-hydroxy-6-metoxy-1,4-benzoquinol methylase
MFEMDRLAVGYSLARLRQVLPPPPARVMEVGCGRGALAAGLGRLGYRVVGVEPDPEAGAVAAARGVEVVCAGVGDIPAGSDQDVVLFTRSLHHIADLDATVGHALRLVRPGGLVVLEEFARERVDQATAGFLYDTRGLLVAAGVLALPEDAVAFDPDADPVERWQAERGDASPAPLHTGAAMLAALTRAGAVVDKPFDTETVWRMIAPPGWVWQGDDRVAAAVVQTTRRVECRRIAEGTLRAVGMVVVAHRVVR